MTATHTFTPLGAVDIDSGSFELRGRDRGAALMVPTAYGDGIYGVDRLDEDGSLWIDLTTDPAPPVAATRTDFHTLDLGGDVLLIADAGARRDEAAMTFQVPQGWVTVEIDFDQNRRPTLMRVCVRVQEED